MENKRISFGYEDTDKKIEINLYGIIFQIRNFEKGTENMCIEFSVESISTKLLQKVVKKELTAKRRITKKLFKS